MPHPTDILDRTPPHDLDAERAVLGAILLDHDRIDGIGLEPRDFHAEPHGILFELLQNYPHAGNVDVALLRRWTTDAGQWERIGGAAYVGELIQAATVAHVGDYAAAIREAAQRRRAIGTALDVVRAAYTANGEWAGELAAGVESLGRLAAGEGGADEPEFAKMLTGADLLALDLRPRFLIRGVLAEGQPCVIGGRSKAMKTSVAADLAVSLGSGTPFLGRFDAERTKVGFWTGESGAGTVRETAIRIADAHGVTLDECDTLWNFNLPKLSQRDHLRHFSRTITRHNLRVAIVDPLYLSLLNGETAGSASNLFAMGAALQPLSELSQEAGVTLVVLHHFRKGGQPSEDDPADLAELTMSGAAEWARQWLLLQRREAYQGDGRHLLWMRCGGSAGHASLWGLTIDEGTLDPETFSGRTWEVAVEPAAVVRADAKAEKENRKAEEQERREGEHRERLLAVLRATPDGETERVLSRAAGLNGANFGRAMFALLQEGRAERCQVTKAKVSYEGFKPTGK